MTSRAIKPTARKTELRLPSFVSTYAFCYARTVIAIERSFNHFLIALHCFFPAIGAKIIRVVRQSRRSYVDLQRRRFPDPTWFLVILVFLVYFFLRFEFSWYISVLLFVVDSRVVERCVRVTRRRRYSRFRCVQLYLLLRENLSPSFERVQIEFLRSVTRIVLSVRRWDFLSESHACVTIRRSCEIVLSWFAAFMLDAWIFGCRIHRR